MNKSAIGLSVLAAALAMATQVHAGTITGGIGLLTPTDASQLESWLGEGPLALTSVFTHQVGDGKTSADFHAAADGKGRTFIGDFNITPNGADRTAALFNLTDVVWKPQNAVGVFGAYQTFNHIDYGPTFGGGFDISSALGDLPSGSLHSYAYGVYNGVDILGGTHNAFVYYGRMEVFTIAADSVSSVPEGGNMAMMIGGGLVCLVAAGRPKPTRPVVTLPQA